MQIRTIRKAYEFKFKPFERDSNANLNQGFEAFKCKLEPFERHWNANSNHSKGIRSIRMQIRTHRTRFEALESKFESLNNVNEIRGIRMEFVTIRKGFKVFERKF